MKSNEYYLWVTQFIIYYYQVTTTHCFEDNTIVIMFWDVDMYVHRMRMDNKLILKRHMFNIRGVLRSHFW